MTFLDIGLASIVAAGMHYMILSFNMGCKGVVSGESPLTRKLLSLEVSK